MGVNPCGLVKLTRAMVPIALVAPFEYCAMTLPLDEMSSPSNSPAAVPLLWMALTPNGRSESVDPAKLSAIDSAAAPFGGVTLIVPLPAVSTPELLKVNVAPLPEPTIVPSVLVSDQWV